MVTSESIDWLKEECVYMHSLLYIQLDSARLLYSDSVCNTLVKMSENLANLKNYKLQLQQVETALVNEPDNEELKKLQEDLNVSLVK